MRRITSILIVVALPVLMSCGGSGGSDYGTNPPPPKDPGGSQGSTSSSVSVLNDYFSPSSTTVKVGTTVTWTWSSNGTLHNVTFDDGTASETQGSGSYTRTFNTKGTFKYHCTQHGSAMSGTIVVQ